MKKLIKWTLAVVIRPVLMAWVIVNGIPPSIRALCSGITQIVKAVNK